METGTVGITDFSAYVPMYRVRREEIVAAHEWANPGLRSLARSERSICSWDEDTITMAVEAGRGCVASSNEEMVALVLGTTTPPYLDRLNSGIVAGALKLNEPFTASDLIGSMRVGTTALLTALDTATARAGRVLCIASDRRAAAAGTVQELMTGHGAAGLSIGHTGVAARFLGSRSLTIDLVDHYRSPDRKFDYSWEERWVRDEYLPLIRRVIEELLADVGVLPGDVNCFCVPSTIPRFAQGVAAACGIPTANLGDDINEGCGNTGAAHPLLMLVRALENAKPNEKILVVGVGQGVDALLFETTDSLTQVQRGEGSVARSLARRNLCGYVRYLTLHNLIETDRGIRSEADKATSLTAAYRHRDLLFGLTGGLCRDCDCYQIPRTALCVNPECGALHSQTPYSFSESAGRVVSFTADWQTYTPDPPARYGMIEFDEGARLMMDITDVSERPLAVGTRVGMTYRIKDIDRLRGLSRYFWKAFPLAGVET